MLHKVIFCYTILFSIAGNATPNEVDVIGVRRESNQVLRPGQTETISPEDPSRFDFSTHIRERSAFDTQTNGNVTSSGFLLPRTRGQDAKATSIYLGDLQLFDPLTGFPLVEDIDLRAFGRLRIHRGISPTTLTTTNPIGSIAIVPVFPRKRQTEIGASYGKPHGTRGYLLVDTPSDRLASRLYLRRHTTDGRYSFFNDNGTPANTEDDSHLTREDNFSQSQQGVPMLIYKHQQMTYRYLGIYSQSQRGIPSLGGRLKTGASMHSESQVSILETIYNSKSADPISPQTLGVHLTYRHETRSTEDPNRSVLVTRTEQDTQVFGHTVAVPSSWEWQHSSLTIRPESGVAQGHIYDVHSGEFFRLRRDFSQLYVGYHQKIGRHLSSEWKGRWRQRQDNDGMNTTPSLVDLGKSLNLGLHFGSSILYLQLGTEERPPGLFEQFGDGGALLPNPNIGEERVIHRELGFIWRRALTWSLNVFRDATQDKVVFVPSFTNSFKAVNLSATEINGIETSLTGHISRLGLDIGLGWSFLDAKDLSIPHKSYLVPRVPKHIANATVGYRLELGVIRLHARYRGLSYGDLLNQTQIPATTIYDTNFDTTKEPFACGVGIHNLMDVKSESFIVPGTDEVGKRAYSELSGYPLPGRTWQFNCKMTL